MKIKLFFIMIFMFLTTNCFAAAQEVVEGMGKKAFRGIGNIVTAPIELPAQIVKGFKNGIEPIDNEGLSKTLGGLLGIFRGVSHAGGRLSWGVLEVAGFWSANPEDNEGVGIPFDDPYPWEEGASYSVFDPSFEEGIKPVGRKIARGLGNGLLGIAEVPGQILRGTSEGNVFKGVLKGFWYWGSRELYGFGDLTTAFLPNPPDNPGVAFNGDMPWTVLSEEME